MDSESRYRLLFDSIDEGFCIVEVLLDERGKAVDYRFLEANPAFERHSGLSGVQGKWIRQIMPTLEEHWFEIFGRVARTGESFRFENHASALGRWFDVFAFRVDDPRDRHVAILFSDISARKASKQALEASLRAEREANALLDALGNGAPVGLAFVDHQLRFRRVNATLAAMDGLAVEAHLGKRPDEIFPDVDEVSDILRRWQTVLAGGEAIVGLEMHRVTEACLGETRTWLQSVFPVRVQGEIVGLGVLIEDVSERARAQQALAASEARFRNLIELGPIGIAIAEPDGRIVMTNDALLAMLGYTREDLESLNWRERTAPEHLALDLETIESQRRGGAAVPFEKEYVRRDGSRVSALVVAQFLPGEGERMIAYALDITDRKNAESALRESEARLRRAADALHDADRRKDDFIATLAHELRNPLAPIRSGVEILRRSAPGDLRLQRTTEMMERQIKHLVRLVDDLLDVSRITRGKIVLRREALDLNQILRRALESTSSLFEQNTQKVVVDIGPEPLFVQGDVDRLTQVFSNLLSNAAKFTPHEGRVWVSATREGNDVRVTVRDDGIGIPPARLEGIFEMFNQVHTPHGNDGLGIGLALVRQILKLHGGSVVAASEGNGRGSCFTVRLPALGRAPATDDAHLTPSVSAHTAAAAADSHHRILVVDDNRDAVESLESLLKLRGHEVATCTSGSDAVALAPRYHPDVILMDLGMPEMDGLTAAHLIRAQPLGSAIRIIALTGWGQESDRERSREAGIDQHLVKPVSWQALIDAVEHGPIDVTH